MASANRRAHMSSLRLLPEKPTRSALSSTPQRRAGNGGGEAGADGVKCTALCLYLPRLLKKKRAAVQPATMSAAPTSAQKAKAKAKKEVPSAPRVSSRWPSSLPRAVSAGAAGRTSSASSQLREASASASASFSFSHWSRSQASRVRPHGAAPGPFSFPSSPASASSGTSTPKLAHGGILTELLGLLYSSSHEGLHYLQRYLQLYPPKDAITIRRKNILYYRRYASTGSSKSSRS
uniref:Uncharacterized protein n=1 Tax=Oryza nivara TaxID=4536 RepID=A0A0E0FUG0_ORYNI